MVLYSIDTVNKQLYSHTLPNGEVDDFRLEISPKSFAGYCAVTGKTINMANAYSAEELKQYEPKLAHNTTWDKLAKSKTSSALVVTLPYEKKLVGVLELLNKEGGERFSEADERLAKELAPTTWKCFDPAGN